jgi:hypothetical protein
MQAKFSSKLVLAAVAAVASVGLAPTAKAATITWGSATNIFNDKDVSNDGSLIDATQVTDTASGGTAITVNNVLFTNPTYDGANLGTSAGGDITFQTSAGDANLQFASPPTSGSAAYNNLVNQDNFDVSSLNLINLIVGQTYEVEIWTDQVLPPSLLNTNFSAGNSVNLTVSPGQYAIGTFTADSGTESISVTGAGAIPVGLLSDVQLRLIPEPASLGILSLGALGLLARRRKS